MTGYPEYNFPAFFAAEEKLREQGFEVVNPARLDTEAGYDPTHPDFVMDKEFLVGAAKRDLLGVIECDAIAMLPEWEKSKGANAELAVAKWLGKKIYLYPSMVQYEQESILDKAKQITSGERQKNYGHPKENFKRIAEMWNVYLDNRTNCWSSISVEDVAWMMVLLKIARDQNKPTYDNLLDSIGYVRTLAMIRGLEK